MTLLTPTGLTAARKHLRANAALGMGNFLWNALEVYPRDHRPFVLAQPFETAWGERCDRPTLGDWARLTEDYARRYAALGVGRQDTVGVYGDHGGKYLLHLMALTRLGAIPVFVNQSMAHDAAARHMRRLGVVGVFTDDPRRDALRAAGAGDLGFSIVEADFRDVNPVSVRSHVHHDDDAVLVTHTSGTTGVPKAVLLQHGGFFHAVSRTLDDARDPVVRRAVCALPPSHNAAISAVAIAMMNGEELILMSDLGGPAVIEAIRTHGATAVVAFPQTHVDILNCEPASGDLRSVAMWINLGDSAHERHIRALTQYGNHRRGRSVVGGSWFLDGLGSSEMGSMLFSIVHAPGAECVGRCVGVPRPWVEAEILDAAGTKLPNGQPGLLAVKSPSVAAGYWNDSNLTYKSRLNGYFLTGDVAYRDASGRFHHLDRTTDTVMTTRGPIYTLLYEEAIMNAVEDLLDCSVIAVETKPGEAHVVCYAILRANRSKDEGVLRAEVDRAVEAQGLQPVDEIRRIHPGDLAVGVTGKVLKAELRRAVRRELDQRSADERLRRVA
jgi:acyl-coenzyme A synthetase/AMP-(fatty) acid ligase